jgi:hypothetical protein
MQIETIRLLQLHVAISVVNPVISLIDWDGEGDWERGEGDSHDFNEEIHSITII